MNHRKQAAWVCAALTFLSFVGCGNTDTKTAEVDVPALTDSVDTTDSDTTTTTKVSGKTTTHTTKQTTSTTATAKTTKGNATTTKKNANASATTTAKQNTASHNSASGQNATQAVQTTAVQANGSTAKTTHTAVVTTAATTAVPAETEPVVVDDTIYITLNGSGAQVTDGNAVSVQGSCITILQAGKYEVSGTLTDGQIIVDAGSESKVNLHLNGVSITCSDSAPLYVQNADTCTLHLDSGSTNFVADSSANALSACIFSKDDLTIKGDGSLTVTGSKKHGIKSTNDVKVKGGNLTVSAVSAAIYGEDSVQVTGGSIAIPVCKDGLQASNTEETAKGFVTVENGYIDVQNATGNGIEAITGITISGGTVNIHSTKSAVNCEYQSIADGCLFVY